MNALEELEGQIDECLMLAHKQNTEGLDRLRSQQTEVLEHLRDQISQRAFARERLHERRIEVLADLYEKMLDAESLVSGDRLRLWRHRHATDGFFAAIWQRA